MEYTFNRDYLFVGFLGNNLSTDLEIPISAYKNFQRVGHTMLFRVVDLNFADDTIKNVSVYSSNLTVENSFTGSIYFLTSTSTISSPLLKISKVPTHLNLTFSKICGVGSIVFEIIYVPEKIQYENSFVKPLN